MTRTYCQPQQYARVERSGVAASLVLASLPGVDIKNLVSRKAASIVGATPTASFKYTDPYGLDLMIHPSGGSSGYAALLFGTETIGSGNDFTLIWVGRPQNFSNSNGQLMVRGLDGFGNGWSLRLIYEGGDTFGGSTLTAGAVDSSPAGFSVSLSNLSLVTDRHERVALVKSGNTIKVFDWRTRQSASASAGNGNLRTSTVGVGLGLASGGFAAGHNKVNTALSFATALDDNSVWSRLDNPWQDFVTARTPPWMKQVAGSSGMKSRWYYEMIGRNASV